MMKYDHLYFPVLSEKIKSYPLYITGIGTTSIDATADKPKGHIYYQITVIEDGDGILYIDDKKIKLKKGNVFFCSKNIPYKIVVPLKHTKWISFDGKFCKQLFEELFNKKYGIIKLDSLYFFLNGFEEIFNLLKNKKNNCDIIALNQLLSILIKFSDSLEKETSAVRKKEILFPAILFMEENYSKDISLYDISSATSLSVYAFSHMFKEIYKITPIHYLLQIRIQKAKLLLLTRQDLAIKDIAEITGFNDSCYFGKIFKRIVGVTPLNYRKK